MSADTILINMGAAAPSPSSRQRSYGRAILFGIAAALAGGAVWFLVAYYLDLQHSIVAIVIGAAVGLVMRSQLSGERSIPLGLVAAVLSVAGIVFGHLLIWQYLIPRAVQDEVYKYDQERVVTRAEVHEIIPFSEYMKEDLGLGTSSREQGKRSKTDLLSWAFYAVALYVGFASVAKKELVKRETSQAPAPPAHPTV